MKYNTEATIRSIGQLQFSGHIIHHTWYQHIKFQNGKPDLIAIMILADIVYWYRPTEIKNEYSGELQGFKKKFKADMLQRNSRAYADLYGISQRQASDAIKRLCDQGLIIREYRTITNNEFTISNVQFLAPMVEAIANIQIPNLTLADQSDELTADENTSANTETNTSLYCLKTPANANVAIDNNHDKNKAGQKNADSNNQSQFRLPNECIIGSTLTTNQQQIITARVNELFTKKIIAAPQPLIAEILFVLQSKNHFVQCQQDFYKKLNTICKYIRLGKWTSPPETLLKHPKPPPDPMQIKKQKWLELQLEHQHWNKMLKLAKNQKSTFSGNLESLNTLVQSAHQELVTFHKQNNLNCELPAVIL